MQQMLLIVGKWIAGIYLVQAVIWDIRKKMVPIILIRLTFAAAILLQVAAAGLAWKESAFGLRELCFSALPGGILLLIGYCTKEAVGYADGWSVLLLGLFVGGKAALCITMFAFLLSAVYALWLVVGKRQDKTARFAFLPHISAGFIMWLMAAG